MGLLTDDEGMIALRLARGAIEHAVTKKKMPNITLTKAFSEKRGVFVTLNKRGELRGCIGFPYPIMPLADAVADAAVSAALQDPRFPPVRAQEIPVLELEVTVLTLPQPLTCDPVQRPAHIEVGRHGLIVRGRGSGGLLLPQVATEYGWDSTTFLDHTCIKAGLSARCWAQSSIEVLTFEGQIFHEQPRAGGATV
jgi:uncharacterized protein (TIGR00296 family)